MAHRSIELNKAVEYIVPVLSVTGAFFEDVQVCSKAPTTMERRPRSGSGDDAASSSLQESIWAAKNFSTSARVLRGKRSDGDAMTRPGFEIGRRATGLISDLVFVGEQKTRAKNQDTHNTAQHQQTTRTADAEGRTTHQFLKGYFFLLNNVRLTY